MLDATVAATDSVKELMATIIKECRINSVRVHGDPRSADTSRQLYSMPGSTLNQLD
jgi:hypothetical protein